jgi:predicted dehydrogenase
VDQSKKLTRREFMKKSALVAGTTVGMAALGEPIVQQVLGANDKIRMGFIGIGNRGSQLLRLFMANPDVEIVALCDIYEPYLLRDRSKVDPRILKEIGNQAPKMGEVFPRKVKRYHDFRTLLESKDVDAVCIATPDHWHAVQMIASVDAGKDVYVEKPLTITLVEGRKMVEAANRTKRIVQVGLNRRGSDSYQELAQMVKDGKIGKVSVARAYRVSNMYPNGIGNAKPEEPPKGFDWDMWLGPRAFRPFQYNIAPYKFRWWNDYSSQMGNWGVHYMDAIRWMIGEQAPVAITARGGKVVLQDDRDIPDTMEVVFEMASGSIIVFGIYEASGGETLPWGEIELRGTKGNVYADQTGYKIVPSKPGQFQDWKTLTEASERKQSVEEVNIANEVITAKVVRNFLDCVKSRKEPWCPLEEGHRSTSFALLANIALAMKMRLEWDPQNERFTNSERANALLHYEYRKPWKLG